MAPRTAWSMVGAHLLSMVLCPTFLAGLRSRCIGPSFECLPTSAASGGCCRTGNSVTSSIASRSIPEPAAWSAARAGVRKVRVAPAGRGKRGGIRVIYYYRAAKELVYLILAYAKAERDTLSGAEKLRIRTLTSQLESEP